jgi:hypothetical protein
MTKTHEELIDLVDRLSFDDYFKVKIKEAISHFDKVWGLSVNGTETESYKDIAFKNKIGSFHFKTCCYQENREYDSIYLSCVLYVNTENMYTKNCASINAFRFEENEDYFMLEKIISHIKTKTV